MIHHFSLSVQEPERVARAIAEIAGGRVVPFSAVAGSFLMMTGGQLDMLIEFYPHGVTIALDEETKGVTIHKEASPPRYIATHVAISVPATQAQIEAMAAREGWTARRAQRGPLDLMELWIENRILLEVFPSDVEKPRLPAQDGPPASM